MLTISNSEIISNVAVGDGGGILQRWSHYVHKSLIASNQANTSKRHGGGINSFGDIEITPKHDHQQQRLPRAAACWSPAARL